MKEFPNTHISPYYIFIKNLKHISDVTLLNRLGLAHYQLKGLKSEIGDEVDIAKPTLFITECQN